MHYKGCAIHKVADRFEVYSRDGLKFYGNTIEQCKERIDAYLNSQKKENERMIKGIGTST